VGDDIQICSACGTSNEAGRNFCGECGESLALICANCGSSNRGTVKFCGECGTRIAGESEEHVEIPTESERRLVTVLFADLAGYTPFSEDRDPEDVREFLTDYFDMSRDVIERFGGVVDKFIGDAVMAVWGAVTANDDDAERAVRAGLELVDTVAKLASDAGHSDLALRVGVLTGEASVGPGGNEKGLVVGDLVNTASRLQSIAEPHTVVVGESTMRAASAAIAFQPIGEQQLKGKTAPVAAFTATSVLSEVGGRGRVDVLEPPFVGRTDELRMLKDLLASVGRDRRSRLVSVVGEGGIGKSRLVWEFRKYTDGLVETIYWHEGRSPAYGDGVAFWAIKEMIHRRAGISEADDDESMIEAFDETLAEFMSSDDADWVRPRLHAVLGLGTAPPGSRSELDAAVRLFFERVAAVHTAVLVFEDMQWADPAMLDFVHELTEWSRDHPILVISLTRNELFERRPDWGTGLRGLVSVNLGRLSAEETRLLVAGAAPQFDDTTVDRVVERSGGVPLFAVELVRMILAGGGAADEAIPETVQAAIGARLDRLSRDDRALVQDAAVLGQSFTIDGLAAVSARSAEDVETALSSLTRSELVEPVRDPRSPERGQYHFVQSMIREVAAGRLNRETKRKRHLAAATYILGLDDPELAPVVADHYLQAYEATPDGAEALELRAAALETLRGAMRRTEDVRSYEQVLSLGEAALRLASDDVERGPLWESMAGAASTSALHDDAVRYGRLALDEARSRSHQTDVDRVVALLGQVYMNAKQQDQAIELLGSHLDGREDLVDSQHLIVAASKLAHAYVIANDASRALSFADRALSAAERRGQWDGVADTLITKGLAMAFMGRFEEAEILVNGGTELADRYGYSHEAIRGRINTDFLLYGTKPAQSATASIEALELARRNGDRSLAFHALNNSIASALRRGDRELFATLVADPLVDAMTGRDRGWNSGYRSVWARREGDVDLASVHSAEALPLRGMGDTMGRMFELWTAIWSDPTTAFDELVEFASTGPQEYGWALDAMARAVMLSADWDRLLRMIDLIDAHPHQMTLIAGLAGAWTMEPDEMAAAVRAHHAVLADVEWREPMIVLLAGGAQFLPGGHPDAKPLLDQALQECEDIGWRGYRDLLIERVRV